MTLTSTTRRTHPSGTARFVAAAAIVCASMGLPGFSTGAFASDNAGGDIPQTRRGPFTLHLMVQTDDRELRNGSRRDWAADLEFGDVPIRRDMMVLYQHWFANDVKVGGLSVAQMPGHYERYEQSIRTMLDRRVPMDFAGYICLDIEFLPTLWGNRTGVPERYPNYAWGPKFYDDWYDYIRANRPELIAGLGSEATEAALAQSYENAVRDWRVWTITKFKELRPNAKFGYFSLPAGMRNSSYARPDPTYRDINDRLRWWVDHGDVIFLPTYQNRRTLPLGHAVTDFRTEMTPEQSRTYITSNVNEGRRMARNGQPVFIIAWSRFMPAVTNGGLDFLDDLASNSMFRTPYEAGADGITLWDAPLRDESEFMALQGFINRSIVPIWRDVLGLPPLPPTDQPGGGGDAPPGGGGDAPPGGGGDAPPGGGGDAPPGGGGDAPPGGGGDAPPSGGGDAPPGGGGDAPPGGGGDAPPGGGGDAPPGGGGDAPPGDGGSGDQTRPGGGGGTPPGGNGSTPPGGTGETPPDSGESSPRGGNTSPHEVQGPTLPENNGQPLSDGNGQAPLVNDGNNPDNQPTGGGGNVENSGSGSGSNSTGGSDESGGSVQPDARTPGQQRMGVGKASTLKVKQQPIRVVGPGTRLQRNVFPLRKSQSVQSTKHRPSRMIMTRVQVKRPPAQFSEE